MANEEWNKDDEEDEVNKPGGYVDQAQAVIEGHLDEDPDPADLGDSFGV